MQYTAFFYLTLLGSSTAQSLSSRAQYARGLHPRDVQTIVTIKSSLKHGTEGVNGVDTAFKAITAANVKEQLVAVNTALTKLSSEVVADMKKLKASGAIGIGEILGLASEAPRNELIAAITGIFGALNTTFTTIGSKRDIIKDSGSVDVIVPGIKSQRQGLVDIIGVVPSQVPSIVKGPINSLIASMVAKAAGGAPPTSAAPPALRRRQTGKGTGKGTPKGGAPKDSAPKGGAPKGGAPSAGSTSGGPTLESLLSSTEAQETIGKAIDGVLDQGIAWLRGTTDNLVPPELLDAISKGAPKGPPKGSGPPKGDGESAAAPPAPKADGDADSTPAPPTPKAAPPTPKAAPPAPKGAAPKGAAPKGAAPKGAFAIEE